MERNPERVEVKECPWCGGELHRSVADVVKPAAMLDGGDFRKVDAEVVQCEACEFIAEPIFRNGILVDESDGREVFCFAPEDVR
jgi:transposase